MAKIETVEQLRRLYTKPPSDRALRKVLDRLDPHCRRFIELSPFFLLASSAVDHTADVSPRGDGPGFVQVLDEKTIAIPDRPGNNRLDTLTNLLGNPEVALIFMVPGVAETLRINGTAEIRDDAGLRESFVVDGRLPLSVVLVTVREAYLHCAKSIMRSRIWDPDARIDQSELPSMGQMIKDQIGSTEPAESQEEMVERYRATLY